MRTCDVMTYRGYASRVEFDADDGLFVGHLADIDDVIAFHAADAPSLEAAFREAVDDYVATCEKVGKRPQGLYSDRLTFLVTPELHARATLAAQISGKSVDEWGKEVLAAAARAVVAD